MKELLKIKDEYLKLIKGDNFDFDKFNEYAIVHHSNSIEGSTLTMSETFLLLDESLTPNNKPLEHTFMALDHLEALKHVIELAKSKKPLTSEIIQNISSLVMKNTGSFISSIGGDFDSSKGDYRKVTVRAGTTTFMDYKKVPERVKLLLEEINKNINKSKDFTSINNLAFDAHYQMVSIHPFADGNGRLSRLIMNYIQSFHNYPMSVVFKEDKNKYYSALEKTRDKGDNKIFRSFMFSQLKKHFEIEIKNMKKIKKTNKSKDTGISFIF